MARKPKPTLRRILLRKVRLDAYAYTDDDLANALLALRAAWMLEVLGATVTPLETVRQVQQGQALAGFYRRGRKRGAVSALTRLLQGIAAAGDVKNRPALHARLEELAHVHSTIIEILSYDPGRTPPAEMVLWTDDRKRDRRTSMDDVWRRYRGIPQGEARSRRRPSV